MGMSCSKWPQGPQTGRVGVQLSVLGHPQLGGKVHCNRVVCCGRLKTFSILCAMCPPPAERIPSLHAPQPMTPALCPPTHYLMTWHNSDDDMPARTCLCRSRTPPGHDCSTATQGTPLASVPLREPWGLGGRQQRL